MFGTLMSLAIVMCGALASRSATELSTRGNDLIVEYGVAASELPQKSVRGITQTTDGRVWVATFGGLAVRGDDGWSTIDSFSNRDLPSSRFTAVTSFGNVVWGGTQEGHLVRLDGGETDVWNVDPGRFIRRIVVSTDDVLLATEKGLARSPRPMSVDSIDWIARGADVLSFCRVDDGSILYTMHDRKEELGHVLRFANGTSKEILPPDGMAWEHPMVGRDASGRMWIADSAGMWRIDGDTVSEHLVYPDGNASRVQHLVSDGDGGMVVLRRSSVERLEFVPTMEAPSFRWQALDLNLTRYFTSYVESSGVIWIGTDQDGLIRCRPAVARRPEIPRALSGLPCWAFAIDGQDQLWLSVQASKSHAASAYAQRVVIEPPCRSMTTDSQGRVFGASPSHIALLEPDGAILLHESMEYINTLAVDEQDACWFGTVRGLYRLDDDRAVPVELPFEAEPNVRCISRDSKNRMLVATDRFVHGRDGEGWRSIELPFDMAPFPIRGLAFDEGDEVLYAWSYGAGLFVIQGTDVRLITESDGLPENFLTAMLIDEERDTAWLMGNRGAYRMSLRDWRRFVDGSGDVPRSFIFDERDGVMEGNAGAPSSIQLDDGWVAFSTIEGPVILPPRDALSGRLTPPRVDRVEVDGATASLEDSTIRLPAGTRRIRARLAGGIPDRPADVHYECLLEGMDDEWTRVGPDRIINYTNLPPGDYVLSVRAAVGDGRWITVLDAVTLSQAPAWHERTSVRVLLVSIGGVGSVAALVLIRHRHRRRVRALQRELDMQRHMQERESLFTAEMNHRVRNNLGAILSLIRLSLPGDSPKVRSLQSRVHAMSTAHRILSDRNWNATPLQEIIRSVVHTHPEGNDALVIEGIDPLIKPTACQPLALVLHELAHNALRHGAWSDGSGRVVVTSSEEDGHLVIRWIEEGEKSIESGSIDEGTGITLMRGLVGHELHGSIDFAVESRGFVVSMRVSMGKCRAGSSPDSGRAA